MKILVIEDDKMSAEHAAAAVGVCGFQCDFARNGREGLGLLSKGSYDIALVDIEMPGLGGLDVLRTARKRGIKTYLLVLSSHASEAERIAGLKMGADDYLVKPISIDELSLRLQAIARRLVPDQEAEVLSCSGVVVNIDKQTVRRNGQPIDLSPREMKLLVLLMRNKGRCLTYDTIADHVWGPIDSVGSVVSANVSRLRKKLAAGGAEEVIHTVRDVGYVFK